jgi:hypothetical protein
MKITLLDGSPKATGSASNAILEGLLGCLENNSTVGIQKARREADYASLWESRSLVLSFPLYVDSFPSEVIGFLEHFSGFANDLPADGPRPILYVIVNSGFHETERSLLVLDQCRLFASMAKLVWGQGLAIGGGPLISMRPEAFKKGSFPFGRHIKALKVLSANILSEASGPDVESKPSMPRFVYNLGANQYWKLLSKKNGLKTSDLYEVTEVKG